MDDFHFDAVSKHLSGLGGRRALLGALAALPLAGGLLGLLSPDEVEAKDRRRRRKQRHQRRKNPGSRKGKTCKPKGIGTVCAGACGAIANRQTCGKTVDCGPCPCTPACDACFTCDVGTQTCVAACAANETCCDAACVDLLTDTDHCGACGNACGEGHECRDGVCGVVCGSAFCPAATQICVDEVCETCDVTCSGSAADCGMALQAALSGSAPTLYVCPGTYLGHLSSDGGFAIGRAVTVIGAGAEQTILDGNNQRRVLAITANVPVTLQALTITRGSDAFGGGGIHTIGDLTLIDAAVTDNHHTGNTSYTGGGGILSYAGLTLRTSRITGNTSGWSGGGIRSEKGIVTLESGSTVQYNTASFGGGVCSDKGSVTLENDSSIERNTASWGGAIWGVSGSVTVEDGALICGNSALQCDGTSSVVGTCPTGDGTCP